MPCNLFFLLWFTEVIIRNITMFYFSKYQHCQLLQYFYFLISIKVWPQDIYGTFSKKKPVPRYWEVSWSQLLCSLKLFTSIKTFTWPCRTADGRTITYQISIHLHRNFSLFSICSMRWFAYCRSELRHWTWWRSTFLYYCRVFSLFRYSGYEFLAVLRQWVYSRWHSLSWGDRQYQCLFN